MSTILPKPLTDDEAVSEVAWVVGEALALLRRNALASQVVALLDRADEYAARKARLLAYIEARR